MPDETGLSSVRKRDSALVGGRAQHSFRITSVSVLSVQSVVNFILAQGSRLLFLAEFLESGIGAQQVPDRIEPKKGRRNGR
jgi:hypothetical protein